jgi:O-acetylhomoserine/O-acetylserine sulfhydrylase-like pyridoxal-dependent enzyme
VDRGAAMFAGEVPGYSYTRLNNPNQDQTAEKIAVLEGLDLLRAAPDSPADVVRALMFSSGMAAVSSAIIGRVKKGEAVIVQTSLYAGTFAFLADYAPRFGIEVVWLDDISLAGW